MTSSSLNWRHIWYSWSFITP